ncbi:hypothetical protein D1007_45676 [Hordeum vulgare]|nr:hypothetical protein D1007_45676 [Hordeum vulgare]
MHHDGLDERGEAARKVLARAAQGQDEAAAARGEANRQPIRPGEARAVPTGGGARRGVAGACAVWREVARFGWGGGRLKVMDPPETTTMLSRADDAQTFEFTIEFFPSKAKLGAGSLRDIEGDTIVKWEVELSYIDPQELQSMEEKADGEEMVDEIDRQNGWTTKQTTFRAELVDLKSDSKVGYVPSKLPAQMVDDDWASERQIMPVCTGEVTILHEGADADAQEGSDGVARVLSVYWNLVESNEPTDLVIAPLHDFNRVTSNTPLQFLR